MSTEALKPVAWGVQNTRITEAKPLMHVMIDKPADAQYPELLVPLYAITPEWREAVIAAADAMAISVSNADRPGAWEPLYDREAMATVKAAQAAELESLRAENADLRTRLDVAERDAALWRAAYKQAWESVGMGDVLSPPGQPGSYARGHHNGFCEALEAIKATRDAAMQPKEQQAQKGEGV